MLKINALTATGERHQTLINGLASGIGELCAKAGLPPQKKNKFAKGSSSGGEDGVDPPVYCSGLNLNSSHSVQALPCLWSGRTGGRVDLHSDQLLVRGFLKYRTP